MQPTAWLETPELLSAGAQALKVPGRLPSHGGRMRLNHNARMSAGREGIRRDFEDLLLVQEQGNGTLAGLGNSSCQGGCTMSALARLKA